ncbi:hypothetical protein GCM10028814_04620 [Angustibacter aerolatus]
MLALILVVWGLMWLGWRGRTRRQGQGDAPAAPSDELLQPAEREGGEATYVSTVLAGGALARVTAHGLGTRSAARLLVAPEGVVLARAGAADVLVPAADLRAVHDEPFQVGKVVPRRGLLVLDWSLGATLVSTAVHLRHAATRPDLEAAITALLPTTGPRS